jgi:BirA family biotin operon repressor/biotin-[acetyl-CoA-carboxylase] ligase
MNTEIITQRNPWLTVVAQEVSASTQLDAKAADQDNILFWSNQQSAARGRFDRPFYTLEGQGIYMSIRVPFEAGIDYTLLTGAAVVKAIESLSPDKRPMIKWVNDIYLGTKKVAGIIAARTGESVIIGIGLNFYGIDFPEEIQHKAGNLFDTTPSITREALIAEIWANFHDLPNYFDIYRDHSLVLGRQVTFTQNGVDYVGHATDLTPHGELVVDVDGHGQMILSSGEISLTSW